MTNLYLLSINGNEFNKMPYGRTDSYLIEAKNEEEARRMASEDDVQSLYSDCWLDSNRTKCEIIETLGSPRIIRDFYNMDA